MARPKSTRPTDVEAGILKVLWEKGEGTVADVHREVIKTKKTAYSSVATIMRIMLDKKLLDLTDRRRPQKFKPTVTKSEMGQTLIADLRDRMFGGSLANLVKHALGGRKQSPKAIAELREMIDSHS